MSAKFEIDQLEERIAPSTVGAMINPTSVGITGNDSVSVGLPLGLGTLSVGVNANDTVSFGGLGAGVSLPSLSSLL